MPEKKSKRDEPYAFARPTAACSMQPFTETSAPPKARHGQHNAGAGIPASINEKQFNQHVAAE
jgi:hypothetical protein